jgi:hypothetical protein
MAICFAIFGFLGGALPEDVVAELGTASICSGLDGEPELVGKALGDDGDFFPRWGGRGGVGGFVCGGGGLGRGAAAAGEGEGDGHAAEQG